MYRLKTYIPPLVVRAMKLAEQMKTTCTCTSEAGRLLQLLASQLQSGVVGEVGAGCGVAAAWIVSSLSPGTSFFTVEENPMQVAAVRALFDPLLNVRIIHGSYVDFLSNWRFGLLYAGQSSPRTEDPELFVRALRSGGMIVMDGLVPEDRLQPDLRTQPDPIRQFWLNDSRLMATEVLVSPDEAVILATLVD
jgi:predicted O-methyltransferase YrrM